MSTAEACALYSVVSLLLFPPQKAVIESASISTGEVLLVSVKKVGFYGAGCSSCGLCQSERPSHQLVTEGARTFLSSTVDPLAMYGSAVCT